jgi:hypothetical protein
MSSPGDDGKPKKRAVLVVYAVFVTQYLKLLLEDVFDVDTGTMAYNAYDVIASPMSVLSRHMMN